MEFPPIQIAYDSKMSTELEPIYYVYYAEGHKEIYRGSYTQCLIVAGAMALNPNSSIEEIRNKCEGYI